MKLSILALSLLASEANASKKSKAGASGSYTSCPNYSGSALSGGSSKKSKAGEALTGETGPGTCENGGTTTVSCGDSFYDDRIFLLKDLVCDGTTDTIELWGENSILDCGGRSIVGRSEGGVSRAIVELHDGASVVNCNFADGLFAIETLGTGCSTIENVSIYDSSDDGIRVSHDGTVVIKDVSVYDAGNDGIETRIPVGDEIFAIFDNVRILNAEDDGIDFARGIDDSGGDVVAEFYGNIFLWGSYRDNLDVNGVQDAHVTVYGNFFAAGSNIEDGVDADNGNSVTFAAGSFSEICENSDNDLEHIVGGIVIVEDGAVVICDNEDTGSNKCIESCNTDEAVACIA